MQTADSEGPAWNKFWMSLGDDTESQVSDGASHRGFTPSVRGAGTESPIAHRPSHNHHLDRHDSVQPNDSASHNGDHSDHGSMLSRAANPMDQPYPFKFKAPSGRVHRLQVTASGGIIELLGAVSEKLGHEISEVGGEPEFGEDGKLSNQGFALSYVDDDGDVVSITSDGDLVEAINLARRGGRDKVDLFVHDPAKPPVHATVDPKPVIKKKPKIEIDGIPEDDDTESEGHSSRRRKKYTAPPEPIVAVQPELIPGVPNEFLLPGAIATLAVVIVATFTLSRLTR